MVAREGLCSQHTPNGKETHFNEAMPLIRPALRYPCGTSFIGRQPTFASIGTPAPDQVRHRATTAREIVQDPVNALRISEDSRRVTP